MADPAIRDTSAQQTCAGSHRHFAAVYAWNDFLGPLIYLQDESRYTLAIGLQFFRSVHDVKFNLLMEASSLVVLPIVVIFLAFQRQLVQGVTIGSIK